MTWDKTNPPGSEVLITGDDRIRETKLDLQTALAAKGAFPIDPVNPVYHYRGDRGNTASRPVNGTGGLYADTQTSDLLRDNGSSWDAIATHLPVGTKMVFYQATAPIGWTIDTSRNGRLLYGDSAYGGGTGVSAGSWNDDTANSGSHTHNVAKYYEAGGGSLVGFRMYFNNDYGGGTYLTIYHTEDTATGGSGVHAPWHSVTGSPSSGDDFVSGSSGSHHHETQHSSGSHEYATVLLCTRA